MNALNNSSLERLGNRTPQSVSTSLSDINSREGDRAKVYSLEDIRVKQLINTQLTHRALDEMQKVRTESGSKPSIQIIVKPTLEQLTLTLATLFSEDSCNVRLVGNLPCACADKVRTEL